MAITNNQMAEAGFTAAQTILIRQLLAEVSGGGATVSWVDVTDKPAVIAAGADAAAARTAIGAGTSSLTIGTTATTAKAGNAVQTAAQTTATAIAPGSATNVQAILAELSARITALE